MNRSRFTIALLLTFGAAAHFSFGNAESDIREDAAEPLVSLQRLLAPGHGEMTPMSCASDCETERDDRRKKCDEYWEKDTAGHQDCVNNAKERYDLCMKFCS